jgi:hypothetical protein
LLSVLTTAEIGCQIFEWMFIYRYSHSASFPGLENSRKFNFRFSIVQLSIGKKITKKEREEKRKKERKKRKIKKENESKRYKCETEGL